MSLDWKFEIVYNFWKQDFQLVLGKLWQQLAYSTYEYVILPLFLLDL